MKDELTGLLDREAFRILVEHELIVARRLGRVDALLVIDVEDLKSVNENFGREGGDETLREVGRLLQRTARESDVVARIGTDEFAIYALDCVGAGLADRISSALVRVSRDVSNTATVHLIGKEQVPIRIRVGITEVDPGEEYDSLISRAGPAALVNAKQQ